MAPPTPPAVDFLSVLDRPADQHRREFQYRFAQSAVFGLPVLALQWFGRSLGGPESDRWVAILQALLRLVRGRLTPDLLPAAFAVLLYLASVMLGIAHVVAPRTGPFPPVYFHWTVAVLVCWTGLRWWQLSGMHKSTSAANDDARPPGPGASNISP